MRRTKRPGNSRFVGVIVIPIYIPLREKTDISDDMLMGKIDKKIFHVQLIIQTLLIIVIFLLLLIKIDSISSFLSNQMNQSLIGIISIIFTIISLLFGKT